MACLAPGDHSATAFLELGPGADFDVTFNRRRHVVDLRLFGYVKTRFVGLPALIGLPIVKMSNVAYATGVSIETAGNFRTKLGTVPITPPTAGYLGKSAGIGRIAVRRRD